MERMFGRQALDLELLKGGFEAFSPTERWEALCRHRPPGLSVARGCELMGLFRSTFYDAPPVPLAEGGPLARAGAICDEFEYYGYCRVGAALRHQSIVVNGKKLRRLMREHDLQPKKRCCYAVTKDSDHKDPIFSDLARDLVPDRPDELLGRGPGLHGEQRTAWDRHEASK